MDLTEELGVGHLRVLGLDFCFDRVELLDDIFTGPLGGGSKAGKKGLEGCVDA